MDEIKGYLFFGIIFILPIVLVVLDIIFMIRKKEKGFFEIFSFVIGGIYTVLAFICWEMPSYDEPLNYWGTAAAHAPINVDYIGAIGLFLAWSFISYFILKFSKKTHSPLMQAFFIAGIYIGIALAIVWLVQLLCGASPQGIERSLVFNDDSTGVIDFTFEEGDYIILTSLCVVPIIYLVHCICLLVRIVKEKAILQERVFYEKEWLNQINVLLCKGANLFWGAVVLLIPILGVLTMILILFGQQPDSVILAFTKTSDWILSGEIAPPPVAYDTHYLCTVSLRGHKKVVKPIRYGMRRGEKIVVNRQLCVANAFEQLIQEKTPRFHRAVRQFYDTYGYPISKHIKSAWAADVVYFIMKPLEWIFVFVLYLCDEKPEDRIYSQYLPR